MAISLWKCGRALALAWVAVFFCFPAVAIADAGMSPPLRFPLLSPLAFDGSFAPLGSWLADGVRIAKFPSLIEADTDDLIRGLNDGLFTSCDLVEVISPSVGAVHSQFGAYQVPTFVGLHCPHRRGSGTA